MPYNKMKIMEMQTDIEEYLTVKEAAGEFNVDGRSIERLIEKYPKLKQYRRWRNGRWEYSWPVLLKVVKIHTGLVKENIPSAVIKRMYTKQRNKGAGTGAVD